MPSCVPHTWGTRSCLAAQSLNDPRESTNNKQLLREISRSFGSRVGTALDPFSGASDIQFYAKIAVVRVSGCETGVSI